MANGLYNTPIPTGISTVLQQQATMVGGTTMPQVSTPMPTMTTMTTPQVSTVMPSSTVVVGNTNAVTKNSSPSPNTISYSTIFSADPDIIFNQKFQNGDIFTVPVSSYSTNFSENQQRLKSNFSSFYEVASPSTSTVPSTMLGDTSNVSMVFNQDMQNVQMEPYMTADQKPSMMQQIKEKKYEINKIPTNTYASIPTQVLSSTLNTSLVSKTTTIPINTFNSSTANQAYQNVSTGTSIISSAFSTKIGIINTFYTTNTR